MPPIKYLQCPAAVTVGHLKRFISSKYTLSLSSGTTQIDIIYEDELLPSDFTLMDVAYTYNWKRVSGFLYHICMHGDTVMVVVVVMKGYVLPPEIFRDLLCWKMGVRESEQ